MRLTTIRNGLKQTISANDFLDYYNIVVEQGLKSSYLCQKDTYFFLVAQPQEFHS